MLEQSGIEVLWLDFDDLISGNVESLETFLDCQLPNRKKSPSHVGAVRSEGKFESFENWNDQDKTSLREICLPLLEKLRSKAAQNHRGKSDLPPIGS